MRVVFDYQAFSIQEYGGVSRYVMELALGISKKEGVNARILALVHINRYLDALKGHNGLVVGWKTPAWRGSWKVRSAINRALSRPYLYRFKPDVVHETYYSDTSIAPSKVSTVVTVHDMIHEKYPQYFARDATGRAKVASVLRAQAVICVSEATRRDVVERYDLNPDKVFVVHHGFLLRTNANKIRQRLVDEPYLLFVGHRSGYKNFQSLLKAYAESTFLRDQFRLVCFGGGTFTPTEQRLIDQLLKSRSEQVCYMAGDDHILSNLYRHAEALVYISMDEGFGIPLLEAMSQGCAVVCSDIDVFREVAGEAAEFVDPVSIDSIAAGVERVLTDPGRRAHLRKIGHERTRIFSWQRCVDETMKVYERVT